MLGRIDGVRVESPGGRVYRWTSPEHGEELFTSVTTILSQGVAKPALPNWAARTTAEAAVALTRSGQLQAMVRRDPDEAVRYLKGAPWRDRDGAASRGSRVHDALERAVLRAAAGEAAPAEGGDPEVAPYLAGFERWRAEAGAAFYAAEATVFSRRYRYAGTLDAIVTLARDPDVLVLVDYKTTRSGLHPEVALQLAAYAHADFLGLPDGREHPMPAVGGAVALHLSPDGYHAAFLARDELDACFEVFLAAYRMAVWALRDAPRLREVLDRR